MRLRELVMADAAAIQQILAGQAAAALRQPDMTLVDAAQYIRRAIAAGAQRPRTQLTLGIDVADDLLGLVALRIIGAEGHLSYVLRDDVWGRGLCTAAVALLPIPPGIEQLTAKYPHGNTASGRVLEKAGFTVTGRDTRFVHTARPVAPSSKAQPQLTGPANSRRNQACSATSACLSSRTDGA